MLIIYRKATVNADITADVSTSSSNMPVPANSEVLYEEIADYNTEVKEVKSEFDTTVCPAYGCKANVAVQSNRGVTCSSARFDTTICPAYGSKIASPFQPNILATRSGVKTNKQMCLNFLRLKCLAEIKYSY